MARIARFVVPGLPHHVTQRGNRRETVFFSVADFDLYRDLLDHQCRKHSVAVWAYCLMLSPRSPDPRPRSGGGAGQGARRDASALQPTNSLHVRNNDLFDT